MSTRQAIDQLQILAGRRRRRKLDRLDVERMLLPRKYWDVSWEQVRPEESTHKAVIRKFLLNIESNINNGYGLLLWGINNVGKTALAAIILMEARRWGFSALFLRSTRLRSAVLDGERFDDSSTMLQRAMKVDVLVIDDLGKEYRTEGSNFMEKLLEDLIRERAFDGRKSTIITTNMSPKEDGILVKTYRESMISTLKRCVFPVEVTGYDYALQEQESLYTAIVP